MYRDRTKLFLSYRRTITRDIPPQRTTPNPFSDLDPEDEDYDVLNSESENLIYSSRRRSHQGSNSDRNGKPGKLGKSNKSGKFGKTDNTGNASKSSQDDVEMRPMIPTQFDIAKDLDLYLTVITRQIRELQNLYKQLIIINKSDMKKQIETQIEESNYQILKNFEKCYIGIKKFEYLAKNHEKLRLNYSLQDLEIVQNMRRNYANKIQVLMMEFRSLQGNYMNFLRDDDDEFERLINEKRNEKMMRMRKSHDGENGANGINGDGTPEDAEAFSKEFLQTQHQYQQQTQQQVHQNYDPLLEQREQEINKLAMGILEISTMFKEMENLVIDQGTMLDRIDYNLTSTVQDLKSSDKELIKAQSYQKRTTKCKIIFFLVLCVFALLMLFMLRPSSSTKIIEKPGSSSSPQSQSDDIPSTGDKPANEVNHPDTPIEDGSKPIDVEDGSS
ncbi:t-SNARE affecting a late Golgi compartment protein 2 [Lodderomyces elongisporus]|uniref:t-SNARE affecting a late Golgi compartment protein 2 n=1 Tax=Lodderomyces elongisporus TaxID=36914 RepID=UPI00291E3881|nr:t-SNARE affecting a late Golgi compartment protein 2 [Lodderomyces elongisporus]WLF77376.1 t-SNARE affecting a late Golgi compartment protein 2 [Lodderomyces elongisporus]